MKKGIIDNKATGGRGVENGKLYILDSCSEEVCDGVRAGMKEDSVEGGKLQSSPLKMYSVSNVVVSNVPCDFFLIVLIDEDERIMLWVGRVVFDLILTWVVCLFLTVSN